MNLETIKRLLSASGESDRVELKKSTANLKAAAQTLCAFLNGHGGAVFIGIGDDHKIIGQAVTDKTKLDISNTLKKFEPSANIDVDYIRVNKGSFVIVMTAHPDSRCVPYIFSGCAYERKQADTHTMSQTRYQQLLLARNIQPVSWEAQPAPGLLLEDLDRAEILKAVEGGIEKGILSPSIRKESLASILTKFSLLKHRQLNNAAAVLFAKDPATEYSQCVLRMARFKGLEKGEFIDSKHVFGNAFYLLAEAENFIHRNTAVASKVIEGQMQRVDKPEYPVKAIREALINSLCHREYASPGGSVTLTIYDDRLELFNTGLLPEGITLPELKELHTSHPRNPKITNVFYRCGLIEAMGMGIQEIMRVCSKEHMDPPEFFEQAGTFMVRLWSHGHKDYTKDVDLSDRQHNILCLLKNTPLSPKDLLAQLEEKISDRTLRNDLQLLKTKGYANSEGQGKQTLWYVTGNPEINPETRK